MLTAQYLFAVQIYGDFAGYSLIAIGAARIMGFRLMDNFLQPFTATTLAEFWRRWHVSLMTWFRDYLYAPVAGKTRTQRRRDIALFVVFLVTGLWHGAGWTFVLWGVYNGVYLLIEAKTKSWRDGFWARWERPEAPQAAGFSLSAGRLRHGLAVWTTFSAFALSAYLFRAHDLAHTVALLRQTVTPGAGLAALVRAVGPHEVVIAALGTALVLVVDSIERKRRMLEIVAKWPWFARAALYAALVLAILLFGEFGHRAFLYFQF